MTTSVRKNAFSHMKMNQPIFRILNIDLDDASWDNHLDNVKKANGKWVLISPMQMHHNIRDQWWSRYQPTSYLYSEKTLSMLSALCAKAAMRNLNIMMDVVWNHTTILKYTKENKYRYHEKKVMQPGVTYSNDEQTKLWFSRGLPDLKTELDEIKQEALMAVMQCRSAGVKGFRIDTLQMIDDAFFDYVFKDTPSHELHLYEMSDSSRYINRMVHRIRTDGCEVVFYDTASYGKIADVANQVLQTTTTENILQLFPPSDHLMNATLDQDMIMSFNNDEPLYLFLYFLISKFVQSDKYFVYNIISFENTSVTIQHLLFNWENYFNTVEPVLRIKNKAPAVIGTLSVYRSSPTSSPMIIGSLGRNYKILVNLKKADNETTTDHIPVRLLFSNANAKSVRLVALLNDAKPVQLDKGAVNVPDNSYTIIKRVDSNESKSATNLVFFWYQGWDEAPKYAKEAVAIWKTYKNGKVICLDRKSIAQYLTADELKTIERIEQCIPKPYLYAAVCDYVRWAVLGRISGIYIDCDVYPTGTTIYLLNCYYEYDRIVLGKEFGKNNYVNNAFIIVPASCQSFVISIVGEMAKNIRALTPDQFVNNHPNNPNHNPKQNHAGNYDDGIYDAGGGSYDAGGGSYDAGGGSYDGNYSSGKYDNDAVFNWVIQNTGPGFLKRVTSDPTKSNQYMILDHMWLYANYQLDNKKDRNLQTCGENMGLIQHCYVGDWVPY